MRWDNEYVDDYDADWLDMSEHEINETSPDDDLSFN